MMPNTNTQCVAGTHTETTIEARPALHSFHEAYGGGYATQDSNPGLADRVPRRTWSRGRTWRKGCTGLLLTRLGLALDRRCTTAQTDASAWSGERRRYPRRLPEPEPEHEPDSSPSPNPNQVTLRHKNNSALASFRIGSGRSLYSNPHPHPHPHPHHHPPPS
eukprot:scaffold13494_cov51-Phaeocystis_antarctica.AAC.1